uniref:Spermatosis associated 6 n=1 Tax=Leptobrachium leishanense TaxID=445787 RepID=A0A8C5R0K9_9ANUR
MQKQNRTSPSQNTGLERGRTSDLPPKSYERPTIASKSRSPSPYTRRRMCELSEDARQRLAHLNLGPYEFKKETECKPPFVVRHMETFSIPPDSTFTLHSPKGSARLQDWDGINNDPSFLGSYRPVIAKVGEQRHTDDLDGSLDSLNDHLLSEPAGKTSLSSRFSLSRSTPPSVQKRSPSPVLDRSSLRERFQSEYRPRASWEEIHERVKNMLKTHSARQRLHFDQGTSDRKVRGGDGLHDDALRVTDLQSSHSSPVKKLVHLDNGHFWSSRAASYRGKSHRAVFEESMQKIYSNMYRKASESSPRIKSQHSL